jgi:hypothetical protein
MDRKTSIGKSLRTLGDEELSAVVGGHEGHHREHEDHDDDDRRRRGQGGGSGSLLSLLQSNSAIIFQLITGNVIGGSLTVSAGVSQGNFVA